MCSRVGCGSRTNITALCVTDHYKAFFLAILYGLVIHFQSLDAELLVHGNLRFHGRDQVPCVIHDLLVKIPDGVCSALQRLPEFSEGLL